LFALRARVKAAATLFPFFVIVNYLVMSLGLAMDTKAVGQPEELLHRPFVWAYFVVVAWSGAGAYILLFGNRPPAGIFARIVVAIIAFSSLSVPFIFGRNLQTLPHTRFATYEAHNSVPSGLVKACSYVRKHSQPRDIIQDSENDPRFWITALAERQEFAIDYKLWAKIYNPPSLRERLNELAAFKNMTNETDVIEFAKRNKISWYILRPESKVAWPVSILRKPAFRAGDYRVYHFAPAGII
jgi:hypothetical protein